MQCDILTAEKIKVTAWIQI